MNGTTPNENRRILPRWRTASQFAAHGELQFSRKLKNKKQNRNSILSASNSLLEKLVTKWRKEQSIENAAELFSAGVVVGVNSAVEDAAKFLVDSSEVVSPAIVDASKRLLGGDFYMGDSNISIFNYQGDITSIYRQISTLKARILTAPRDAISWIELARLYSFLGQIEPARTCIQVAIGLAPENRFVLRSASRFFVHSGNVDEGLHLIRKSNSIANDPWLQATEISLADISETSSKFLKIAIRDILTDTWSPRHSAELSGAAATTLSANGKHSQARKLMKLSLRDPNENTLAQAQWASIKGWAPEISLEEFQECSAPEASALRDRHENHWEMAVTECIRWSDMEPTSSRPLDYGAFISLVALEDGNKALNFLTRSKLRFPNNPMILNNLAVAYAYNGDIREASTQLNQVNSIRLPEDKQPVITATKGLIAYRKGDIESGRKFYFDAIEKADEIKIEPLKVLAIWHLLREESKIGTPGLENLVDSVAKRFGNSSKSIPELSELQKRVIVDLKKSRKNYPRDLTRLQNSNGYRDIGG